MKLNEAAVQIESSGIQCQSSFSIKASAKAFRILSDGLYSKKITAIIRELSCNAYDSHIQAGKKDVPIHIHLPNNIEPWFSVRDNGIGLSHEQVLKLYTTYFESTKTGSNDVIGQLGLGSKSPFCYTNSFTVLSNYDGIRRIYSAFIGENGFPQIAQLHEEPTDACNGIEVKVPVESKDFSEFVSEAKEVLEYFSPVPTINRQNLLVYSKKITYQEPGFRVFGEDRYTHGGFAVMGTVAYPLNKHVLGLSYEDNNLLNSFNIEIDVAIGDVEITASRESLSYDERTIENLKKKLTNHLASFRENYVKENFTGINNFWDYCVKVIKNRDFLESTGLIKDVQIHDVSGRKVKYSFNTYTIMAEYVAEKKLTVRPSLETFELVDTKNGDVRVKKISDGLSFAPSDLLDIFIGNETKPGQNRGRFRNAGDINDIMIRCDDVDFIEFFEKNLDSPRPLIKTSTLPEYKIVRKTTESGDREKIYGYIFRFNLMHPITNLEEYEEFDGVTYFAPVKYGKTTKIDIDNLESVYSLLKTPDTRLVGVRLADIEDVPSDWLDLSEEFVAVYSKEIENTNKNNITGIREFFSQTDCFSEVIDAVMELTDDVPAIEEFVAARKLMNETTVKHNSTLDTVYHILTKNSPVYNSTVGDLMKKYRKLLKDCPLINTVGSSYNKVQLDNALTKHMVQYIKQFA